MSRLINQSINQSINYSVDQSFSQQISESICQHYIDQSTNQSINQSIIIEVHTHSLVMEEVLIKSDDMHCMTVFFLMPGED